MGKLPCKCNGADVCSVCKVRQAVSALEAVYHDDVKRAQAVHDLIFAMKQAAVKDWQETDQ
jgi:hypothetical protein